MTMKQYEVQERDVTEAYDRPGITASLGPRCYKHYSAYLKLASLSDSRWKEYDHTIIEMAMGMKMLAWRLDTLTSRARCS